MAGQYLSGLWQQNKFHDYTNVKPEIADVRFASKTWLCISNLNSKSEQYLKFLLIVIPIHGQHFSSSLSLIHESIFLLCNKTYILHRV
jgi:hypothetical protein